MGYAPTLRAGNPAVGQDLTQYLCLPLRYKVNCQSSELYKDILVPSFYPKSKHCVFQGDLLLFSCAGAHPTHQRICPCRDFIKGQVALCKDCL